MTTRTVKTPTTFTVMSTTSSPSRFSVNAMIGNDITAAGQKVYVEGWGGLQSGLYTVTGTPSPTGYSFDVVESLPDLLSGSYGPLVRAYDFHNTTTWVDAHVPVAGETASIPATAYVYAWTADTAKGIRIENSGHLTYDNYNNFSYINSLPGSMCHFVSNDGPGINKGIIVTNSGTPDTTPGILFDDITDNEGIIIAKAGGYISCQTTTHGLCIAQNGGTVDIDNACNFTKTMIIESGGTVNFKYLSFNTGTIIVKSGGTLNFIVQDPPDDNPGSTGYIIAYQDAVVNLNGITLSVPVYSMPSVNRSAHYPDDFGIDKIMGIDVFYIASMAGI